MSNTIKIAPSLLAANCANFERDIKQIENSIDMLHFDVMDGHFVPNLSYGAQICAAVNKVTEIMLDVHLMVTNPLNFIEMFARSGADIITFHIEANDDPKEVINRIKSFGIKPGIAIKPKTGVESVLPYLDQLDMVLQMTVEPGFGGQTMVESAINNISEIRRIFSGDIQVDGGIKADNVAKPARAGANVFVAGTAIFGSNNPIEAANDIRKAATL